MFLMYYVFTHAATHAPTPRETGTGYWGGDCPVAQEAQTIVPRLGGKWEGPELSLGVSACRLLLGCGQLCLPDRGCLGPGWERAQHLGCLHAQREGEGAWGWDSRRGVWWLLQGPGKWRTCVCLSTHLAEWWAAIYWGKPRWQCQSRALLNTPTEGCGVSGDWGLETGGVCRLWEGRYRKKGKQGPTWARTLVQVVGPRGNVMVPEPIGHSSLNPRSLQVNWPPVEWGQLILNPSAQYPLSSLDWLLGGFTPKFIRNTQMEFSKCPRPRILHFIWLLAHHQEEAGAGGIAPIV